MPSPRLPRRHINSPPSARYAAPACTVRTSSTSTQCLLHSRQTLSTARRQVLTAMRSDLQRAGSTWNPSVMCVGGVGHKFPDRPMMRTLAAYDSHKRADYNFRAEVIERRPLCHAPKPSQWGHAEDDENLRAPPKCSRSEFAVHPSLSRKTPWDSSTSNLLSAELEGELRARQR